MALRTGLRREPKANSQEPILRLEASAALLL
jgi:hypothetical protein